MNSASVEVSDAAPVSWLYGASPAWAATHLPDNVDATEADTPRAPWSSGPFDSMYAKRFKGRAGSKHRPEKVASVHLRRDRVIGVVDATQTQAVQQRDPLPPEQGQPGTSPPR